MALLFLLVYAGANKHIYLTSYYRTVDYSIYLTKILLSLAVDVVHYNIVCIRDIETIIQYKYGVGTQYIL